MTTDSTETLELVVYQLTDGTTQEQFFAAYDALSEWLVTQPGFVSRELSRAGDEDRWIELVWWTTREAAESAAAAAADSAVCAPFFAAIDLASALLLYADPVTRTPIG